jgi:cytochrome c-type biogenesis protein CcmH
MMWSLVVAGLVAMGPPDPQPPQKGEVAPRFPAEVETEAAKIFNSTMSPFCPGLLVANCPSPGAANMKEQIRIQLAAGASPDSVRAWLRAEYGSQIEAVPPAAGFGLLAWIMPALALLGGGAVIAWWLHRRGRVPARGWRPVEALDPEAQARLDRELAEL